MIIGLATPRVASSIEEGLEKVERCLSEAAAQGAEIVCFPEAYLPGLRGLDFEVPAFDAAQEERVLGTAAELARKYKVATVLGMERLTDAGRQIAAVVLDAQGEILGSQTKNQLDPTEDPLYVPGDTRQLFEVNGLKFGVAICHEGFRYPETVRWAARRGAKLVFHPHCTGSDKSGVRLTQWGAASSPYYEKAMMMRSIENAIYFASVNYAFRYQESATSLIGPSGGCQAYLPYGQEGVLVQDIDPEAATGVLAARYAPERYQDAKREGTFSDNLATLRRRAAAARRERRWQDAQRDLAEAVALCREAGDALALAHTLRHLGDLHQDAGRLDLSEPCYVEALAIYRGHGQAPPLDLANAIRPLAILKDQTGAAAEATRLWQEARDLYAAVGVSAGVEECAARLARSR